MNGPGKYDALCTYISQQTEIDKNGGAVILVVIGGNRGNGFSVQSSLSLSRDLPLILEEMALKLRNDMNIQR
jgi:hypothetical protein